MTEHLTQSVYEIMLTSFMKAYNITKEEAEKRIADITKGVQDEKEA